MGLPGVLVIDVANVIHVDGLGTTVAADSPVRSSGH